MSLFGFDGTWKKPARTAQSLRFSSTTAPRVRPGKSAGKSYAADAHIAQFMKSTRGSFAYELPSKKSPMAKRPTVSVTRSMSRLPGSCKGPSATSSCSPPRPKVWRKK